MVSTEMNCGSYHLNPHATDDTGDHFSDGRYLGILRVGKGAFYVWPLDPPPPHRYRKPMYCSWIALVFASAGVNTD